MKLPNKLRDYEHSIIRHFPTILKELSGKNLTLFQLRRADGIKNIPISEFIEALDCLYFLNKIDILQGGVLVYVENADVRQI